MIFGAALLNVVVLNSLTFVDGGVASSLHLELVNSINGDGSPDIARVTVAASAHERQAIDINGADGTTAAGAVDDTGVGGCVAIGVVALPPSIETSNATLGATMENELYSALPLEMGANGQPDQRRATDFAFLMPGVLQSVAARS